MFRNEHDIAPRVRHWTCGKMYATAPPREAGQDSERIAETQVSRNAIEEVAAICKVVLLKRRLEEIGGDQEIESFNRTFVGKVD